VPTQINERFAVLVSRQSEALAVRAQGVGFRRARARNRVSARASCWSVPHPSTGALHDSAATCARAPLTVRIEPLEHGRKLLLDVRKLEELLVEEIAAGLAVPLEAVALAGATLAAR